MHRLSRNAISWDWAATHQQCRSKVGRGFRKREIPASFYRKGSAKVSQSMRASESRFAHCQGTSRYPRPGCAWTIIIEIVLWRERNRKVQLRKVRSRGSVLYSICRRCRPCHIARTRVEHAFAERSKRRDATRSVRELSTDSFRDVRQYSYSKKSRFMAFLI